MAFVVTGTVSALCLGRDNDIGGGGKAKIGVLETSVGDSEILPRGSTMRSDESFVVGERLRVPSGKFVESDDRCLLGDLPRLAASGSRAFGPGLAGGDRNL